MTPLCVAARAGSRVAANALLSAGAEANMPLLCASEKPSSGDMILALLGGGADVNTRRASDGSTPLHLAAEVCSKVNVGVLLKAGGDETAVNDDGFIPLDLIRDSFKLALARMIENSENEIRTMLINAPKNRAWSRRGFFVLCRAFRERVRLQLAPSQGVRGDDARSAASSASDYRLDSRMNKKRLATPCSAPPRPSLPEERCDMGRLAEGAHTEDSATAFRAAMGRLMGLEADVVFRTIIEFV